MDAVKPRERLLGPALRTQPDRRLVALARDGSTPAQEEIVRRYRAALVRFAGSIVGPAAAEDVVQESLTKGLAAIEGGDEELRLRPWLYAIVRNTALNHRRDAGPATEQLDESYDGVEQPPQALERQERVRSLFSGLRGLPRQQREAIVKRELEGRSHDEIAAELGVSSGAARQLIFRAREALRVGFGSLLPLPLLRWLAESGGGDAAVGVAAGAGGGALAAKAAVAVFAAGAAVTAGVALDHGARRQADPPAAEAAVRPAVALPDRVGGAGASGAEDVAVALGGGGSPRSGDDSGRGSDSSGHGRGGEREDGEDRGGDGGFGPSAHSGPGHGGEARDDFGVREKSGGGEHSGRSGSGHSGGGDDRGGSSPGGSGSSGSGSGGKSGSGSGGTSGSSESGGAGSSGGDGSGSGSGGSGSSTSGGSSGGSSSGSSGSSGSGGDALATTSTPPPPPAPVPIEESSSGSGSSGSGDFADDSRDLSGGLVSQGSDDPD